MKLIIPTIMVAAVAGIGAFAVYRLVTNKAGDGGLAMLGSPLNMSQNRYYRGRIRMRESGAEPFLPGADAATLAAALSALGFSDVRIYMNDAQLPGGWPSSTRSNADPLTRWFEGQWRGASVSLPRPADIEAMWISKPPPGATYTASVSGEPCPPGKDCGCEDCGPRKLKEYYMRPSINNVGPGYFNSSFADEMMG
jgi:hypothetical protein